ncbi:hypothetical protein Q4575_03480 [Psychrosphaera sp. 1_MG-2023]|uniref:Uncharacterized protein n=1 Tax=Psychrosphaera algicola TaxID=3023714 RepID=A0ABT5F9X8_9GAMM|nr:MULTISPECIES: hypothetical protein [unclassified Psychrosphaera]MDC2888333.1 hypothetical protein [Psychrosphaera sp. G1-22]MDO6718445.1 hypothetical protein [Psychrosphaera sp. 1_MG-2023]
MRELIEYELSGICGGAITNEIPLMPAVIEIPKHLKQLLIRF